MRTRPSLAALRRSRLPALLVGAALGIALSVAGTSESGAAPRHDRRAPTGRGWTGRRVLPVELRPSPGAAPRPAVLCIREVWDLGDGVRTVWGTWRWASTPAPRRDSAARADGDFVLSRDGDRLGGCFTGLGDHGLLVRPTADGDCEWLFVARSPPQDPGPGRAARSIDDVWAIPPSVFEGDDLPRTTRDVLVLYTPRALLDAGGSREHLRHCLESAIGTANGVFGLSDLRTTFLPVALVPAPFDDAPQSLLSLWCAARSPADPTWGSLVARLAARSHADVVLLVTGRHAGERCGGYGAAGQDGAPGLAVVPVDELGSGDLTLAHELGHCLGLRHAAAGVMSYGDANGCRHRELILGREAWSTVGPPR